MKVEELNARLERLADEATTGAATPDVRVVTRRLRHRRTRRVTGAALAVAALAAVVAMVPAGVLELPGDLGGILDRAPTDGGSPADGGQDDGTGPDRPEGEPPIGYAGFWYGKIDASVYLRDPNSDSEVNATSDQQRAAVREQLESLGMVVEVFHETPAEAYEHFAEQWADQPEWVEQVANEPLPESFRVLLDQPGSFGAFQEALCPPERAAEPLPCGPAIEAVIDQNDLLRPMLGDTWPGRTDVTVFLTTNADAGQREAIQKRLEGVPQVEQVFFESAADAALNASQELVNLSGGRTPKLPASFRVSLRSPAIGTAEAFADAFCDSRRTGDCAPGVAMVMLHPRG